MRDGDEGTPGRRGEIRLKGMGYGLRVVLPESLSEESLLDELGKIPSQAYQLPLGEGVVFDFQARSCSEELILKILARVVWPQGLRVLAWLSSHEETSARLRDAGLRVEEPSPAAPSLFADRPPTLTLYHSLRSGQKVEAEGDVVLWGHLNVGAEIFAAGSVAVLGRLKGLVHAGRDGREDVYVIAGSFEPQQVRMGDKLSYSDPSMEWWQKPALITLQNGKLIVRETASLMGSP